MKTKILIIALIIGFASCKKEETASPTPQPPPDTTQQNPPPDPNANKGSIIFYVKRVDNGIWNYGFKIWINNPTGTGNETGSTGSVPNFDPYCGSTWGVNYWNEAGTYNYHIETFNGEHHYDGTFTIIAQDCVQYPFSNQH